MDALTTIQEKFSSLENFQQFADFLTGSEITENELKSLYDFLNAQ
jgi:benzoyl-CoA reductase/2-hydroxyglutaryl-CoA dehydratase subunit BcrC/BadD/HgdB